MAAEERFYRPGQVIFKEGDPSNSLIIIRKGTIAIRKRKGGAYVDIARVYQNEVLGELGFFDRLQRSASAVALTEVETQEISYQDLEKIYANIPPYMKTIMKAVTDRLRRANESIKRLQRNLVDEAEGVVEEDAPEPGADEVMAENFGDGTATESTGAESIANDSNDDEDPK